MSLKVPEEWSVGHDDNNELTRHRLLDNHAHDI
jgi:hypothetical protein